LAAREEPCRSSAAFLTAVSPNKIGPSDLPNWNIRFLQFQTGVSGFCSFHVAMHPII
jgi:hypothetical protein